MQLIELCTRTSFAVSIGVFMVLPYESQFLFRVFCKTAAKGKYFLSIFLDHPVQNAQFLFCGHAIGDAVHVACNERIIFSRVSTAKPVTLLDSL